MSTQDHRAEREPRRRSVLRELGAEIAEDRVLGLAAEIAFFTVLSLSLIGDGLQDAVNPRLRGR